MSSNIEDQDSVHYDSITMHHYVNVNFHQQKDLEKEEEEKEEEKPALPPRPDKTKLEGAGGQNEYEKIKEREDGLERIHKRSRELIRGHFDGPPTNNSFRPARILMREAEERRRVKSPMREDYKDFSSLHRRDHSNLSDDLDLDSSLESVSDFLTARHQRQSSCFSVHCSCRDLIPQETQLAQQMSVENRLLALEGDKDYLSLQMRAMSDKLLFQNDKVKHLQQNLQQKSVDLRNTEDQVHLELLGRSELETRKLELMTEMSALKLKQTEVERENSELRRKLELLEMSDSLNNNWSPATTTVSQKLREGTPSRGATSYFQESGVFRSSVYSCKEKSPGGRIVMQPAVIAPRPRAQTPIVTKPRGLRKILNKLRRANSVNVPQSQPELETARLSSISCESLASSASSFQVWEPEALCSWFDSLGLYMYTAEIMRNVKDGQHLINICSTNELANKLGIKNVLHQKKICLAVEAQRNKHSDKQPGNLDHTWVTRWLEDLGLPQYKDSFLEARVDGRVLDKLTDSDLNGLKISNELHQLSVKCGVRLLRENNFDPSCLKRRSTPGEKIKFEDDIIFWTNHRVMEWLRHIELAEYAQNVRGTGVHGALISYERNFSPDLLATIIGIPVGKTLMRRHLSYHLQTVMAHRTQQQALV